MRILQMLFGLFLLITGANHFLHWMPIPEKAGFAQEFISILERSRYIFPTIGLIMVSSGFLMLINRFQTLALLLQLPISFNIFLFHLFHDKEGVGIGAFIFIANGLLLINTINNINHLLINDEGEV